jgi:hypothetical protein
MNEEVALAMTDAERKTLHKWFREQGPGMAFLGYLYRAYVIADKRTVDQLCSQLSEKELQTLAIRLQLLSTHVRSVLDARRSSE